MLRLRFVDCDVGFVLGLRLGCVFVRFACVAEFGLMLRVSGLILCLLLSAL